MACDSVQLQQCQQTAVIYPKMSTNSCQIKAGHGPRALTIMFMSFKKIFFSDNSASLDGGLNVETIDK